MYMHVHTRAQTHTWLGALRNLDLKLVGIHGKLGRHAKAAAGNLRACSARIRTRAHQEPSRGSSTCAQN